MPQTTLLTHFPNGIAQFPLAAVGAAAGVITCTGVKKTQDRIVMVRADTLNATTGCVTASADLTSEFSIKSNDLIDNTGGTSTAGKNVTCLVARAYS